MSFLRGAARDSRCSNCCWSSRSSRFSSFLLPAINTAKQKANSISCASNLRAIGNAVQLYLQDHNNFYPRIEALPEGAGSSIYPHQSSAHPLSLHGRNHRSVRQLRHYGQDHPMSLGHAMSAPPVAPLRSTARAMIGAPPWMMRPRTSRLSIAAVSAPPTRMERLSRSSENPPGV